MNLSQPSVELLLLLAAPAAAAAVVAALGHQRAHLIRWVSLATACLSLFLALLLAGRFMARQAERAASEEKARAGVPLPTFRPEFVPGSPGPGGSEQAPHATSWDLIDLLPEEPDSGAIQFYIGLDGINVWLVVLTAVLFLPSVLVSWRHIDERVNEFYAWLLALQTTMFGIFLSFDIILFYVFFELSLVPLFFLIGIWGGPQRQHAARKFFIYTLTGSLITLVGVLGLVLACNFYENELTFSIPRLVEIVHLQIQNPDLRERWATIQFWVFLALTAGFAVKVPLVPFHTWLPLAHVEAPTAGSVDLAGVLLKVGAYGFLRLCLPLAPDVSLSLGVPLLSTLAAVGVIWGALCAYAQDDIKSLVAYSSVSHLGMCMLGMFALNVAGLSGSLMMMINHGLSTAGLFLLVGMLYERYHTRRIADYGGMATRLPLLGAFMVFVCLTSVGLPGLNGFIGEVLVLFGVFDREWTAGGWPVYGLIGLCGVFLGAWYLLTMLRGVFFGPTKEPDTPGHEHVGDLGWREVWTIVPIAALCLLIGVYPQPLLDTAKPDLQTIERIAELAREREREAKAGGAVVALQE